MSYTGVIRNRYGTPHGARYALTAKVDPADVERIDAAAAAAGVTRSRWIAEALVRALAAVEAVPLSAASTAPSGAAVVTLEPRKAA